MLYSTITYITWEASVLYSICTLYALHIPNYEAYVALCNLLRQQHAAPGRCAMSSQRHGLQSMPILEHGYWSRPVRRTLVCVHMSANLSWTSDQKHRASRGLFRACQSFQNMDMGASEMDTVLYVCTDLWCRAN